MTPTPTSSQDHDAGARRRPAARTKFWRRKQQRHIDPFANRQKSLESHGINFWAMLLGLVAAFTALLLAYSNMFPSDSPKPTDEPMAAEVEIAEAPASVLAELRAQQPDETAGPDQRVKFHERRLAVAEQLERLPGLSEAERVEIYATQLDACRQTIALSQEMERDPLAAINQLRLIAEPLVNDFDAGLRLDSRLAVIELDALTAEPNFRIIAGHCLDLIDLDRFPDHWKVRGAILSAVNAYHDRESSEAGAKLAKLLADKIRKRNTQLEDKQLEDLAVACADLAAIWESDYDQAWENRAINGTAGLQQLQTVALKLAASRDAGLSRLKLIEEIAIWLEQHQASDLALPIHEALAQQAQRADGYRHPDVSDRADLIGTRGIKRCELYQQPLEISGVRLDGPPLDNSLLDDRIGIIVFWSTHGRGANQSIQVLEQLKRDLLARGREPVQMLAVCIDHRSDPDFDTQRHEQRLAQVQQDSRGAFIICVRGPDDNLPIFEQCPSDRVPRILLTDRKRRVVELDIPIEQVQTQVGSFLLPEGR